MGTGSTYLRRMGAHFAVLLSGFLFSACATAADKPSSEKSAPPIIAVGDLHGDYDAYMAIIRDAGLVNDRGRWTGGEARFVQVGDVPDRGPDTRKILDHLMKLEKQAARKGGEVAALIGNHEAMNITGDLRYVTAGEYAEFMTSKSKSLRNAYFKSNQEAFENIYREKDPALTDDQIRAAFDADYPLGYVEHRRAWAPDGKYGKWVAGHDAIRIVGETLFLHGGVSASYLSTPIDDINAQVRAALKGEGSAAILTDDLGPLWYRGNAEETEEGAQEVEAVLRTFNVERIVIGHTPNKSGVKSLYDGKVIIVDTGASAYYQGTRSYLKINGGVLTAVDNGVATTLTEGVQ